MSNNNLAREKFEEGMTDFARELGAFWAGATEKQAPEKFGAPKCW